MSKPSQDFLIFIEARVKETGYKYGSLRDVLTDVMQECKDEGYDFAVMLRSAEEVFDQESDFDENV